MSEAKKLPSGRWRNRLYVGRTPEGKPIIESFTADTKREADRLAANRAREIELGASKYRTPMLLTVGDAVDKYIELHEAVLAENTVRNYLGCRRLYFGSLMDVRICDLTPELIAQAIGSEARQHAPKTVRNAWGLITAAISAACPEYHLPDRIMLPQKVKPETVIPTDEEVQAILEDLRGRSLFIPVALAATCGLRRGEIAGLDLKKDIDFTRGLLHVRRTVLITKDGEWKTVSRAKTYDSRRTVEVPDWVLDAIREAGPDYVMPTMNWITNGFKRSAEKLGLVDLHLHCLRHYYASTLIALGVPEKYIMERLGHSTPNMLRTVYGHIISDRDREIGNAIAAHLSTLKPADVST